jgi:hypothetical protein
MKLSRSSFYHKLKDRGQVEMQREADLRGKIEAVLNIPAMATGGLLSN